MTDTDKTCGNCVSCEKYIRYNGKSWWVCENYAKSVGRLVIITPPGDPACENWSGDPAGKARETDRREKREKRRQGLMTAAEAKRIIHPDTTLEALAEIKGDNAKVAAVDEACLVACAALDKQIPKKLTNFTIDNNGYTIYDCECPSCEQSHRELFPFAFCIHCGQALEWEE